MDRKSRRMKTNLEQYKKMIELVRTKPDIGQGISRRSKDEIEEFWENVAQELNMEGPPIRDAYQWKKRWIEWKCYVRRKLDKCKRTHTMHRMSHMDDEVIKLADLDRADVLEDEDDYVAPIKRRKQTIRLSPTAVGDKYRSGTDSHPLNECHSGSNGQNFGGALQQQQQQQQQKTVSMNIEILSESENNREDLFSYDDEEAISTASLQYNEEENEMKLLQQQLDIQKILYEESKEFQIQTNTVLQDIFHNLNGLNQSIEKMEEMNEQRLKEKLRHNRKTEELIQKIVESEFRRRGNNRK